MKKMYDKYFKVSDDALISHSTFMINIVFSTVVIAMCVAVMSMSAFAYFSYSLSSSHNTIVSASYNLSVVNKQNIENRDGIFVLDNSTNSIAAEYTFEVIKPKSATASVGFGEIDVYEDETLISKEYTQPIGKIGENTVNYRDYKIIVPAGKIYTVKFIAHWGTCSASVVGVHDTVIEISKEEYDNSSDTIEVIVEETTDEESETDSEETDEESNGDETEEDTSDDTIVDDETITDPDTGDDESNNQDTSDDSNQTDDVNPDDTTNEDSSDTVDPDLDNDSSGTDNEDESNNQDTSDDSNQTDENLNQEDTNQESIEDSQSDEVVITQEENI